MSNLAEQAKSIFLAAAQVPPADRAAYLDDACAGDAALRQRVEALLRANDAPDTGGFADDPLAAERLANAAPARGAGFSRKLPAPSWSRSRSSTCRRNPGRPAQASSR